MTGSSSCNEWTERLDALLQQPCVLFAATACTLRVARWRSRLVVLPRPFDMCLQTHYVCLSVVWLLYHAYAFLVVIIAALLWMA